MVKIYGRKWGKCERIRCSSRCLNLLAIVKVISCVSSVYICVGVQMCVWVHVVMHRDTQRWCLVFHFVHWEKVSQSNPELAIRLTVLASRLALGIPCLILPGVKLWLFMWLWGSKLYSCPPVFKNFNCRAVSPVCFVLSLREATQKLRCQLSFINSYLDIW